MAACGVRQVLDESMYGVLEEEFEGGARAVARAHEGLFYASVLWNDICIVTCMSRCNQ